MISTGGEDAGLSDTLHRAETSFNTLPLQDVGNTQQGCNTSQSTLRLVEAFEGGHGGVGQRAPPRANRLQHVELYTDVPDRPESGRRIYLQARVEWSTSGLPLDGQTVYFVSRPDTHNAANGDAGFRYGDETQSAETTDENGWAWACFEMSTHGGDVFTLYATLDPSVRDGLVEIGRFEAFVPEVRVTEFVELDDGDQPVALSSRRTQYVRRTRTLQAPEQGPSLRFKARLEWRDSQRQGESLAGRKIFFLTPIYLDRDESDGALQGFDGAVERLAVEVGEDGWTAPVTFRMTTVHRRRIELRATEHELGEHQIGLRLGDYVVDDSPTPAVRVVEIVAVRSDRMTAYPAQLAVAGTVVPKRRQYVNIDEVPAHDVERLEYGPRLRIKARVEPLDPSVQLADAVQGQFVYFYQSKASAQILGHADPATFRGRGDTESTSKGRRSTIGPDGWSFPVEIDLPDAGGNLYQFAATADGTNGGTGGLKTCEFETWRKLWFQISAMRKSALFGTGNPYDVPHDKLSPAFAAAFIEMSREGEPLALDHEKVLYSDHRMLDYAKRNMTFAKTPFKVHVLGVHKILSQDEEQFDLKLTQWVYEGVEKNTVDLPQRDLWLKSVQYRVGSSGNWGDLPDSCVTQVVSTASKTKIRIDLTGRLRRAPSSQNPVFIRLKLRVFSSHAQGLTRDYPHTFINVGGSLLDRAFDSLDFMTDYNALYNETAAHEIGHTLTMVPVSSPKYDTHHTSGGHCQDIQCIMYYTMNRDAWPNQFCDVCRRLLCEVDFAAVKREFKQNLI